MKIGGIKLKKFNINMVIAFAMAEFIGLYAYGAEITVRQIINESEEQTINGDTYVGITNLSENGGAIYNAGTLIVNQGVFTNNFGKNGGAIYNTGTLVVNGGRFENNAAYINGGAIYSDGTLTINSTETDAVVFDGNTASSANANDLYLQGVDANNRAVLNLNAYDSDVHNIQLSGGVTGNLYDVNINANATGQITVNGISGADNLTINAGNLVSDSAVSVGELNVIGSDTGLAVNGDLTALGGGANAGIISGVGVFTIGNGLDTVVLSNTGFIRKSVNITENAKLTTNANLLRASIQNDGALELQDAVLSQEISGSGITYITGNVTSTANIANSIDIGSGKALTLMSAGLLGNSVNNVGTLTIGGGTIASDIIITGTTGTTIIDGVVIADNIVVQNVLQIGAGNSLQINAAGLRGAVENSGELVLGDGLLSRQITGAGTTYINGLVQTTTNQIANEIVINDANQLTTNADNIGGDITNDAGRVILTGGELGSSILGDGETFVSGVVSVDNAAYIENAVTVNGTNELTASAGVFGGDITNSAGTLKLTGGILDANILGAGETRASGAIAVNSNIANTLYLDTGGAITFNSGAAMADGGTVIANGGNLSLANDAIQTTDLNNINLKQDLNLVLDIDLENMQSDVLNANYDAQSVADKWIIVSQLNLLSNTTDIIDENSVINIATGDIGQQIKLADDIEFTNPGDIATVMLGYRYDADTGGNINLSYATLENAVVSDVATNKTIVLGANATIDGGATPTDLVGDALIVSGAGHSLNGNGGAGIAIGENQNLTMTNVANIDGFSNALVNNGGMVDLKNVNFGANNDIDIVNNAGTLNLDNVQVYSITNDATLVANGTVVLNGDITGVGSLLVADGAVLNLGANSINQNTITVNGKVQTSANALGVLTAQTISGNGVLELLGVRSTGLYHIFDGESDLVVDAGALFNTENTATGTVVSVKPANEIALGYNINLDAAQTIVNLSNSSSVKLAEFGAMVRDELLAGNSAAVNSAHIAVQPVVAPMIQSVATSAQDMVADLSMDHITTKVAKNEQARVVGIWAQGAYSKIKQNGAFSGNGHGGAAGVDIAFDNTKLFGIGYSFLNSDIATSTRDVDVNTSTLFLYGQYKLTNLYANAVFNYSVSDYSETAPAFGTSITADYDAKSLGGQFVAGYDFLNGMKQELGLRYMHIMGEEYTNSVGIKNKFDDSNYLTVTLGTRYAREFNVAKGLMLRPEIKYAVKYDAVADNMHATISMPGVNAYDIKIDRLSRVAGELGASLGAKYRGFDLSLNYDIEIRDGYTAQMGRVKFKYDF